MDGQVLVRANQIKSARFVAGRDRPTVGPRELARLRIAAQAVAAPRRRVALESDDETALAAFCTETSVLGVAVRARE